MVRRYTGPQTSDYIQQVPTEDVGNDYGAMR